MSENGTERYLPTGAVRCKAHRRDGAQCGNPAMRGTSTCRMHGGKAPQVQRAARARLAAMIDPALDVLQRLMSDPKVAEAVCLRAAENVLDRAGLPRNVDMSQPDIAREVLVAHLIALRDTMNDDEGTVA